MSNGMRAFGSLPGKYTFNGAEALAEFMEVPEICRNSVNGFGALG